MTGYTLDPKAAQKADVIFSKIEAKGKYLGVFTRAEPVVSQKGTTGVELSFKSDAGETADYLTLWTHKSDGTQLMGFNMLMAIMMCLRVKTLTESSAVIEKYDHEQGTRARVNVVLFKELMNKSVGLLLSMEEYQKQSGGTAWKPVISGAFDKDGFVASEIMNKSPVASTLQKMEAALRDKPMKPSRQAGATSSEAPTTDFDDDIPFN